MGSALTKPAWSLRALISKVACSNRRSLAARLAPKRPPGAKHYQSRVEEREGVRSGWCVPGRQVFEPPPGTLQSTSSSSYFPQTLTKFPRFGISTFARLLAFTTSSLPMSSLRYRMYAVTA